MTQHFTYKPEHPLPGTEYEICYSNSAQASSSIVITITDESGGNEETVNLSLDGQGKACFTRTAPDDGRDGELLSTPGSDDAGVIFAES